MPNREIASHVYDCSNTKVAELQRYLDFHVVLIKLLAVASSVLSEHKEAFCEAHVNEPELEAGWRAVVFCMGFVCSSEYTSAGKTNNVCVVVQTN